MLMNSKNYVLFAIISLKNLFFKDSQKGTKWIPDPNERKKGLGEDQFPTLISKTRLWFEPIFF